MKFLISLVLVTLVSGCASTRSLSISPTNPQPPIRQGNALILQSKQAHTVAVQPLTAVFSTAPSQLPAFYVVVGNGRLPDLDFSLSNVTASADSQNVKVYTFDELAEQIDAAAADFADAFKHRPLPQYESVSRPMNMPPAPHAPNYRIETSMKANAAAALGAEVKAQGRVEGARAYVDAVRDARLKRIQSVLKPSLLGPGQFAGGMVVLRAEDLWYRKQLRLAVTIGGELHEFFFEIR